MYLQLDPNGAGFRAPILPIFTEGLIGAFEFGYDLERSFKNNAPINQAPAKAYPWQSTNITTPGIANSGNMSWMEGGARARYFQTEFSDANNLGICVMAKLNELAVSNTGALVSTAKSTANNDYGFNLYFNSSGGGISYARQYNNGGTRGRITPTLTGLTPGAWAVYWAGHSWNGSTGLVRLERRVPTLISASQNTLSWAPDLTTNTVRMFEWWSLAATGPIVSMKYVFLFNQYPSDEARTSLSKIIFDNCTRDGFTFGT
jgi:hypothetical protein